MRVLITDEKTKALRALEVVDACFSEDVFEGTDKRTTLGVKTGLLLELSNGKRVIVIKSDTAIYDMDNNVVEELSKTWCLDLSGKAYTAIFL